MSESEPFISVVTPCYNGAEFLADCIESVLGQTYSNFEYIIVNNCSTDDTLAIAQAYARKDARIRVHDNTDFLTVTVNHNHALSLISPESKYCKVVSADDWIFRDCVRQMVELAEAHPRVGIVGSYSLEGKRLLFEGLDYEQRVIDGHEICRGTLLGEIPYVFGGPTTLLYRADLIRGVEEFFPFANNNPHADVSACYQALRTSDFGFVHQVLSYTRVHAASETSSSFKYGRTHRALLADVVRFGPVYLSAEELASQTEIMLGKFYAWLVPALVEHAFSQEFLQMQREGLRSIGFELEPSKLARAALGRLGELLGSPRATSRKITEMLGRRGKIVARGTALT